MTVGDDCKWRNQIKDFGGIKQTKFTLDSVEMLGMGSKIKSKIGLETIFSLSWVQICLSWMA